MKNVLSVVFITVMSMFLQACGCTVVDPGNRGVKVHLGEVSQTALPEGLVWHAPVITNVNQVSVRQQTKGVVADSYSLDKQQVTVTIKVLYRIPENKVIKIFQDFQGDPFDTIISPKLQEVFKQIASVESAADMLKNRQKMKEATLVKVREVVGDLVIIEDVVLENIDLSDVLEKAIEQKMVQEQEAEKAKFAQQKERIDAETAVIKAEGEARAIAVRGKAIRENPGLVDLMIAEKWNGVAPLVVGNGQGSNILLPLDKK